MEEQLKDRNNYLSELLNVVIEGRLAQQSLEASLKIIENLKIEIDILNDAVEIAVKDRNKWHKAATKKSSKTISKKKVRK